MARAVTAHDEECILEIRKNKANLVRVVLKTVVSSRSKTSSHWLDIRQWWEKDGPDNPLQPTQRGCMIHRSQVPAVAMAVLDRIPEGDIEMSELVQLKRIVERHIQWWKDGNGRVQQAVDPDAGAADGQGEP